MLADSTGYRFTTTIASLLKNIKGILPEGKSLPDDSWEARHRGILTLLWLHVIGVVCFGLFMGEELGHSLLEGSILVPMAIAAGWLKGHRKFRSAMTSLGLITASALFIHLSGGYIEAHFHFFVMLAVIVLYQDWFPFLVAIGYVFFHHGVAGVIDPTAVYNHPDAFAHPWKWATIHGAFILAASVAGLISWRVNESLRTTIELILNSTGEGIIGIDLHGKITFMNPAAAEMTGYEVKELMGHRLSGLFYQAEGTTARPFESKAWIKALTEKDCVQSAIEGTFWHKDRTTFAAEYICTPIRKAGIVVGAVVVFKNVTERLQAQAALQKAKEELEIRVKERTADLEEANMRLRFELTERQRAEADLAKRATELEESRSFLNSIIESLPTMLFTKETQDFRYTHFNRAAEEITGRSAAEIIGKNDYDLFSATEAGFFTDKDREALAEGALVDIPEQTIHTPHKGVRFLHTRKIPIMGADGKPKYLLGISEDITERKLAEAALIDSEARYRAIATTMPGTIYQFTSRNGVWTVDYVAPQVFEFFGIDPADILQDLNNFTCHIHPDDIGNFVESVAEAVENLSCWNFEGRLINPTTGELVWWQGLSTPISTTKGEAIFNGILLNITERKQAEAALRQSEQRFRQVVSSISDHIYVTKLTTTGEATNLYVSPHIAPLTGYPIDKFIKDWNFWPSTLIHPDDKAAATIQAKQLAKGESSELEYRIIRADGNIVWVRDSGRVERERNGQELIIYGLVSDITGRKQEEMILEMARDQALESSRLKTELLAKVSHELRTPLNAILGFAELLKLQVDAPDAGKQRRMTNEIIDSAHYLTDIVNELLDQAQLEAGRLVLNTHCFTPFDLIDGALARMNVLARTKGLSLISDIDNAVPPTLCGDMDRLQQILVNLISNAIKFTTTGSVQVRLYCPDTHHWALQVSDTGSGIPSEAHSYIFEPFRQVDGSMTRKQPGTGLGLSIVKQLTTMMDGEIILESAIGRGSTFTIILPMQPTEEIVI
ncbi:MAG: PAS domain S-box protein [Anaerolineae bacterium]|nr:PAS domain S-box protein [Anaerolineae bacterium]